MATVRQTQSPPPTVTWTRFIMCLADDAIRVAARRVPSYSPRKFFYQRLEAGIGAERIEPGIGLNESDVITVTLLVGLFEQVDGGILFAESDADQREIER